MGSKICSRTRHLFALAVWPLILLTILGSCTQMLGGKAEIRQKRLFRIDVERVLKYLENSERPYDFMVQIDDFDMPSSYNKLRILSSTSRYEVKEDSYNSWAQRPKEMITDVVAGYLREAQLFSQLVRPRDLRDRRPDYILKGEIKSIERLDSGDQWYARLVMTMALEKTETSQTIWEGEITEQDDIEVFDPDMERAISAMSGLLRLKMERFIKEIDFKFLHMDRDDVALQLPGNGEEANYSGTDTTETEREIPTHYELIPGKIAQ